MIQTFKCKETERIFQRGHSLRFPVDIQRIALRKLIVLHAAPSLNALRVPPGNRLQNLGGDRKGQHSIRVNDQWHICFRWSEGNAYDVEIADYH